MIFDLTLPNNYGVPTHPSDPLSDRLIPRNVPPQLLGPVVDVAFRRPVMTRAAVPKATVNEDGELRPFKNYVGTSRQTTIGLIGHSKPPEIRSKLDLRPRVRLTYSAHDLRAFLRRPNVDHYVPTSRSILRFV